MAKKIGIAVFMLVAGFFTYVWLLPSEYVIARELGMNAAPEVIFTYINSSKKAGEWMPWKETDPTVQMVYTGPDEGVGSTSSWDSTGKMGTGKAVVVESVANQRVKTQLSYAKPMQMEQLAEISLTRAEGGTTVRWEVTGKNSFVGRIFCVFMNMDKMVGGMFEKGLTTLKGKVEQNKG